MKTSESIAVDYYGPLADCFLEKAGIVLEGLPRVLTYPITGERIGVGVRTPEGWTRLDGPSSLYFHSFKQNVDGEITEFALTTGEARPAWLLRDYESMLLEFNRINEKAAVPAFGPEEVAYLHELLMSYYGR